MSYVQIIAAWALIAIVSLTVSVQGNLSVDKYQINISEEQIADLKERLALHKLPDPVARIGLQNELGIELADMQSLIDYWMNEFDWKAQETELNKIPQFNTTIDGINLHFLHVQADQSKYPTSTPLLLVHGWPSTAFDFRYLIPQLVDPLAHGGSIDDAFDVIVPSMPGFPLSSAPVTARFGAKQVAATYATLMRRLGYSKYLVNGGDWGSIIVPELAMHEEKLQAAGGSFATTHLMGVHINGVVSLPPVFSWFSWTAVKTAFSLLFPSLGFDEYDRAKLQFLNRTPLEASYFLQQVTKPFTIGLVLQSSPVAIAAWLTEKFITWTDCAQSASSPPTAPVKAESLADKLDPTLHRLSLSLPKDDILTTVSLYWFTSSITSSVMMYHNTVQFSSALQQLQDIKVQIPCAVADFPVDIIWSPLAWARHAYTNIIQYTRMPRGGHFAALEEPGLLAADLRTFKAAVLKLQSTTASKMDL